MLDGLLTVYIHHFHPILNGTNPNSFAQVSGWCSTRLFLQAFQIGSQLDIVDADFAGRREFNGAGCSVDSKGGHSGGVKHRGGAEKTELVSRTVQINNLGTES